MLFRVAKYSVCACVSFSKFEIESTHERGHAGTQKWKKIELSHTSWPPHLIRQFFLHLMNTTGFLRKDKHIKYR